MISSYGRVYSLKTLTFRKPSIDKGGYELITLNNHGKVYAIRIHQLVARAFIPKHGNKNQVNHINGIKTDNYYWNLEWVSAKENIHHAIKTGLSNYARGEKSGKSKYSDDQITNVCILLETVKYSKNDISDITGVDRHMVNDIYKGRYWQHISKLYDFSSRKKLDEDKKNKIHQVCKLLESNRYNLFEIEKQTGISFKSVSEILHRKTYKKISSQYKIDNFKKFNHDK